MNSKNKNRLLNKEQGYTWFIGAFILVAILMMYVLLIRREKIQYTTEFIEDALTTSALSGLTWDSSGVALTGDVIVPDDAKCYETVCRCFGGNIGLSTHGRKNAFAGASPLFNTSSNDVYITKMVLYNVYSDGSIVSYSYTDNGSGAVRTVGTESLTPKGEMVTQTSIYLEAQFPVVVSGTTGIVSKMEYVTLKDVPIVP
jgi:hypothetical protein